MEFEPRRKLRITNYERSELDPLRHDLFEIFDPVGLCYVIIHACFDRLFFVAGHGVRGMSDDRQCPESVILPQLSRQLYAAQSRSQEEVHQDKINLRLIELFERYGSA